jgi:hypothetical protein
MSHQLRRARVNLKAIGLVPALALALSPLAARAQATPAPGAPAQPLMQTTFSTPLKIVGFSGYFTVTPRGSSTTWTCPEGGPTSIAAGTPPTIVFTLSPDGNVFVANANGGALKIDMAKAQLATAATGDALDAAPLRAYTTIGSTQPTLFGTSPTAATTGFSLLYSPAAGLAASVMTGTQMLGVFTVNGAKWQVGLFPQDEAQSAADATGATPPPKARGDVVVTGGACKGSPVTGTAYAK